MQDWPMVQHLQIITLLMLRGANSIKVSIDLAKRGNRRVPHAQSLTCEDHLGFIFNTASTVNFLELMDQHCSTSQLC